MTDLSRAAVTIRASLHMIPHRPARSPHLFIGQLRDSSSLRAKTARAFEAKA